MNWILPIELTPVNAGTLNGFMSFQITFTGEQPEKSAEAIAEIIYLLTHSTYKGKNVVLQGKFPSEAIMTTLVMGLKQAGYLIQAIVSGEVYYSWLSLTLKNGKKVIDWLTVALQTIIWPVFEADEVIYFARTLSDPEPELPNNTSLYYLSVVSSFTTEELFKFLKGARYHWHLRTFNSELARISQEVK